MRIIALPARLLLSLSAASYMIYSFVNFVDDDYDDEAAAAASYPRSAIIM